jgi:hypothetical protein
VDLVYATVESASPVTNSWTFILPYDPGYGIYIRDTTAPVPDDYDISQFTASTTDAGNVGLGDGDDAATYIAHDRSAQGQTFTTGEESVYELTSVWVRHVQGYDTWSVFDFGDTDRLRITDPSQAGTTNFVIYSELLTVVDDAAGSMVGTPINGTGYWIEYRLQNPVQLSGSTQYGFDISTDSAESGEFFEIAGVVANAYDGGSAYSSGATGFGSDNLDTVWDGDRTFLVDLSIPGASVVPEIQSLSIADDSATLVWDSEPGVTYRILRRSAMSSGDWTEAKAGIEGTGETTVDSVSLTGQNHEFYRIEGN